MFNSYKHSMICTDKLRLSLRFNYSFMVRFRGEGLGLGFYGQVPFNVHTPPTDEFF